MYMGGEVCGCVMVVHGVVEVTQCNLIRTIAST
jgi:hypothetical protein